MIKLEVSINDKKGTISPLLHGQFIEYLGSCIHDGIWVGEDSAIPNCHGIRQATIDALKAIRPPLMRWPGGCYADTYHWRDGIGPKDRRPMTFNENFFTNKPENNHFGTDEFMAFCAMIGAEPWLNINMLSGSVAEMRDWAEYCNRSSGCSQAGERAANGHPEPYHVKYWGIGNESWAGGGNYTAGGYADEYRKYASAMPNFMLEKNEDGTPFRMQLIAVGPDGNKPSERFRWTSGFFEALADFRMPPLNAIDLHFYNWNIGDPTDQISDFNEVHWYKVLAGCLELEDILLQQKALIAEGLAKIPEAEGFWKSPAPRCDLIVGEWGNWHGNMGNGDGPALWQQCTMRDALTTALTLDIFHRNCDVLQAACTAQTVNVLNSLILTEGDRFVLTPNYYIYQMYMVHRDAAKLQLAASGMTDIAADPHAIPEVGSFASAKDGIVSLNLVNTSYDAEKVVRVSFDEKVSFHSAQLLKGEKPQSCNSFDHPDLVVPVDAATPVQDEIGWRITLPAASVAVYRFAIDV